MKRNKLKNISSNGFKVPKNYFEELEDKVFSKIDEGNIPLEVDSSGFATPDNYFGTIEDRIIDKVSEDREVKVISLLSKRNLIYASSIAAAMVIMFSLTLKNTDPNFDNLETETVENYILDENISSYEIASLLTEEELLEDVYVEHDLQKENIEAYLLDNVTIDDLIIE